MGGSMTEIWIDFRNAMDQADQLEAVAAGLDQLSCGSLEMSMEMLSEAWKGENAERFLEKEDRLKKDIRELSLQIRSAADDVRSTARQLCRAKTDAPRPAEEGEI